MDDLKKLGWIIFNIIIYGLWVGFIYQINFLLGSFEWEDTLFSRTWIILSLIIQWFGGIYVVIKVQEFIIKKMNNY